MRFFDLFKKAEAPSFEIRSRPDEKRESLVYELFQRQGDSLTPDEFKKDRIVALSARDYALAKRLQELIFDGIATEAGGSQRVIVPLKHIAFADEEERELLGVRTEQGWRLTVRNRGIFGGRKNTIRLQWTTPEGNYDPESKNEVIANDGGFFDRKRHTYRVLPKELLEVRRLVQEAGEEFDETADEYRYLARIQRAVEKADALERRGIATVDIDEQLLREDYLAPESVRVDVRQRDDGGLDLRPIVDGFDTFDEAEELETAPENKRLFTRTRGNRRVRVALDQKARRETTRVIKKKHVPREDVPRFVANPREYIQPASELAEEREQRARELGVDVTELDELEEDVLDLTSLGLAFEDLDLSDYGDRVIGFEELEKRNVESSSTGIELGVGGGGGKKQEDAIRVGLVTADNDEELTYEAMVSQTWREAFEKLGMPELFEGQFYPHQEAGYAWLRALEGAATRSDGDGDGSKGGLLADDMGLGKTIQLIGLFAYLAANDKLGPSLLVVPKSVIPNWEQELQRFCKTDLNIYHHMGASRLRDEELIASQDIILTTYATMRIDQLLLGRIKFQVMALDEAQNIKNYTSGQAAAARAMDARLRISLTATPVENNLVELWALFDHAQPGLLRDLKSFRSDFITPIENGDEEVTHNLLVHLHDHYLRRTKQGELADQLPKKYVHPIEVELTPVQQDRYDEVLDYYRSLNEGPLGAIRNLLAVCDHPYSLSEALPRERFPFPELETILNDEDLLVESSAKMKFVRKKLREISQADEKVILFSTPRILQTFLARLVEIDHGFKPEIINGDVAAYDRQGAVDDFNQSNGFNVIILSTQAAGVGLNVTGANHVIHVHREWNPAKENQATDRAYRIGQTRDVHVYLPIATHPGDRDSLDTKLDQVIASKKDLAERVIRPSGSIKVSKDDFGDIFSS